jgi:peptidoglycan/xylan/chitin deacetylase (PgdA/CDA1 family)
MKNTFIYKVLNSALVSLSPGLRISRIFTFHGIADEGCTKNNINNEVIRKFMEFLKEQDSNFYTIKEYHATLKDKKAIILTFDDGKKSSYKFAIDYLYPQKIKATFFIPTAIFDENNMITDSYSSENMSRENVAELHMLGFEIGSHSHSHAKLSDLKEEMLESDTILSKTVLENIINEEIVSFAYPYGLRNCFSDITYKINDNNLIILRNSLLSILIFSYFNVVFENPYLGFYIWFFIGAIYAYYYKIKPVKND